MNTEKAMPEEKMVNATELAKILGVSPNTVYRKAIEGQIPCLRIGRAVRFRLEAVLHALAETAEM